MSKDDSQQVYVYNARSLNMEKARVKRLLKEKEKEFERRKEYLDHNKGRLLLSSVLPGPNASTAMGIGLAKRLLLGKKKNKEKKSGGPGFLSFAGKGAVEASLISLGYFVFKKWIKGKFKKKEKVVE